MSPSRIRIIFAIAITLLIGVAAADAQAATYYVSPSGNDSNSGTISSPFATPGHALNAASTGDTVYLRGGTYTLTQPLNVGVDNLTIASYTGESAAITGTVNDTNVLLYMIYISSNNVSLVGLDISGGSYFGVKLESNTGTVIQNCNIHDNGCDNIKMYLSDNVLFEGNQMGPNGNRDDSDAQCINAVACNGAHVRNNYFHDSAQNGLYFKGGSTGCVIEQNLVVNSGYAGILLGQDTDEQFMRDGTQFEAINCIARNNIVVNAGGCGIGTWSGNNLQVENNTLYNVAQSYNGGLYNCANSRTVQSQQITFKNNIVVVTSSRPMFYCIDISDQLMSDNNLYFNPNGGYGFWMETPSTGNYWNNISDWQSGMGADAHSLTQHDPKLDSSNNYKPESGSPALGAGVPVSGVTNDYAGTTRPQGGPFDIGAWQMSQGAKAAPQVSVHASPASGTSPLTVNFSATVTDPGASVSSYNWSFGDGQSSSQSAPSHVYNAGSYTASLIITDSTGATASATTSISVAQPVHQAPQVSISASTTSGQAPLAVNFSANVTDQGATISSYAWSFGDGQTSNSASPSHVYTSGGAFTASLTVTDSTGATGTASMPINVAQQNQAQPPQANVTASATSGVAPLPVNFTASVNDPGSQITSYNWNFGDGQTSSSQSPSHVYSAVGNFTVTLVVTDSAGLQGTGSTTIAVSAASEPAAQPVSWTNIVGVAAKGNTIRKTVPSAWGNAGAGSAQSIGSGDGYVMFGVSENTTQRIIGLSNRNYAQTWGDVAFGIMLNDDGTFSVNESGQNSPSFGNYTIGDIFKVAIDSGLVNYSRNGVIFYTSATKPAYPMWAGAILGTNGATVDAAVLSSASDIGLAVQIASPGPQQVVKGKAQVKITWTINGETDNGGATEVMFSGDGGATWAVIALGIPGKTLSYTWAVAPMKTKTAMVRVIWQTPNGSLIAGTSGLFTVKTSNQKAK
ncbi:MAG TPA: PKD domain-containing protein [Blastocatellia bacterium]|nr:PKD domain-containing protein [Blastocatellia bacterium]